MKHHPGSRVAALFAALSLLAFAGCASSTTREASAPMPAARLSATNQVGQIAVSLSDEARDKLKDNLKFNPDALREHVERALTGYSILNPERKAELGRIDVVVTSMRVRSNFSAVMWGAMAGADNISGDVLVFDAAGKQVDKFHVSASYALGGFAGGQDDARMGWLYEAFAKRLIEEITGTKSK